MADAPRLVSNITFIASDSSATVFFSTHILDVAEKLCSRVSIIKNGKIVTTGTMKEIKGDKSLEKVFLELEG